MNSLDDRCGRGVAGSVGTRPGQGRNAVDSVVEHEQRERLATIRLAEIVEAAEPLEILPGLMVPVASAAHLVVLELLARDDDVRPQDAIDLRALRPTLTPADHAEVRRLVGLVTARGFHRDRDLAMLAQAYLAKP